MSTIDETTKTALDELLKEDDNAIPDSELDFVTGGAVKTKTPSRTTKKKKKPVSTISNTPNLTPAEPILVPEDPDAIPLSDLEAAP